MSYKLKAVVGATGNVGREISVPSRNGSSLISEIVALSFPRFDWKRGFVR